MATSFFMLFMLLFSGDMFKQVLNAPPRDLVSLVNADAALTTLQVKTDEESLLNVLNRKDERTAVEPGRPDMAYVKELLVIRRLEQLKSQKALPGLDGLAKGEDVTLADAAREAAAIIRGQPSGRPSGSDALKQIATMLPDDIGFVAVLDFERNAGEKTVAEYIGDAKKALEKRMPAEMVKMLPLNDSQVTQATQALVRAVGTAGNIRLDAVVVAVSKDIGPDQGYVGIIFKGLGDPARIRSAVFPGIKEAREFKGHKIYADGWSPAICFLDEHTLVLGAAPEPKIIEDLAPVAAYMDKILEAVTSGKKTVQPPTIQAAFDLVVAKGNRLAASGSLTEKQKTAIKDSLAPELERAGARFDQASKGNNETRATQLKAAVSALEAVLNLTRPDRFAAYVSADAVIHVEAQCADDKAAKDVADAWVTLDKDGRAAMQAMAGQMRAGPMGLAGLDMTKEMWRIEAAGKAVRMTADLTAISQMAGQVLGFHVSMPAPPATVPPPPPAPPTQ